MSKKTLGKGLEAIFGEGLEATINDINNAEQGKSESSEISISKIVPNPYQPRKQFDQEKIKELSDSIVESGLISPIVVKKTEGNKFYIIAGERRYRAHKLAGLKNIKAVELDVDDKKMAELAIIENVQRENLNPIEEAVSIKTLIETHNITQTEAAKVLGKSRSYVANLLGLLKLDQKIIDGVLNGEVTYGQVKTLGTLEKKVALEFFDRIVKEGLTARESENLTGAYKLRMAKSKKGAQRKSIKKDESLVYVEDLLRNKVKSKVEVTDNKIIIKYKGTSQLNRILKRLDALEDE